MNFQLPEVGENKVFMVDFSEVSGGRFDPRANHPRRFQIETSIHNSGFPSKPLHELVKMPKRIVTDIESGEIYLGLENVEITAGDFLESKAEKDSIGSAFSFESGEILYPKLRPYLNKTHLAKFSGICSTEFHVLKAHGIKSEFLCLFLRSPMMVELATVLMTGTTLPRLQTTDIENFQIPIPPTPVQEKVVARMEEAYAQKRQKDAQAKAQLTQIDAILLQELGITPPAKVPDKVEDRCFFRDFSQVSGERLSAPSQWKKLNWQSPLFPSVPLVEVAHVNPLTSFAGLHDEDEVSFVPMDAVSDAFGEMHKSDTRVITGMQGYTVFQNEDLLWAKITPCMENGKSAVARDLVKGVGFGSTEFHVFRAKGNTLNIDFLHALFRLQLLRDHARLNFGGSAGHQRVDKDYFERLAIPLPPRPVQDAIVSQIQSLRQSAKALFALAQTELDAAKVAVEAIILGDK